MKQVKESRAEIRTKIVELENFIKNQPQLELETIHHFSEGVYARELRIPAGSVLTGKIHRHENLNFLMKGTISVVTEEGAQVLQAPQIIVSPPGTKRAGYVLEDTIWVTVHASEERDLKKLEELFIVKSFDELPNTVKLEE